MKSLKLSIIGIVLFLSIAAQAEVKVSINVLTPPTWGLLGYPDVRYYFLPDVQAYYDIQTSMFIVNQAGGWVYRTCLPVRYKTYDLSAGYKVAITDYVGDAPYKYFRIHKSKFTRGYQNKENNSTNESLVKSNSNKKESKSNDKSNGL